jgi:hypothetical protein
MQNLGSHPRPMESEHTLSQKFQVICLYTQVQKALLWFELHKVAVLIPGKTKRWRNLKKEGVKSRSRKTLAPSPSCQALFASTKINVFKGIFAFEILGLHIIWKNIHITVDNMSVWQKYHHINSNQKKSFTFYFTHCMVCREGVDQHGF